MICWFLPHSFRVRDCKVAVFIFQVTDPAAPIRIETFKIKLTSMWIDKNIIVRYCNVCALKLTCLIASLSSSDFVGWTAIGKKKLVKATTPFWQRTLSASLRNAGKSNQWAATQATTTWADSFLAGLISAGLTLRSLAKINYRSQHSELNLTYWNSTLVG
jgi:hypothetical protein